MADTHVTAEETAALREVFVPVSAQTTSAALGDLRQKALAYGAACRVSGVGADVVAAWKALDEALVEACQI